jgi:hypothetical protein
MNTFHWVKFSKSWALMPVKLAALIALSTVFCPTQRALAQSPKPDFSGSWVLDKTKSDFGGTPAPESMSEVIEHREPKIVITTTTKQSGGEDQRIVRLTTDGAENANEFAGHQVKTATHWNGDRLVTVVQDQGGRQFTETRALSADRKTQTVILDSGMGQQKLVMMKK